MGRFKLGGVVSEGWGRGLGLDGVRSECSVRGFASCGVVAPCRVVVWCRKRRAAVCARLAGFVALLMGGETSMLESYW